MKLPLFIWTGVSVTPSNWLLNNLISYYDMESWIDIHWSNNFTLSWSSTVSGKIWNAQSFDWINDWWTALDNADLRLTWSYTLSMWYKSKDNSATNHRILVKDDATDYNNWYWLRQNAWNLYYSHFPASWSVADDWNTWVSVTLNTYHHIGITFNSTTNALKIYKDWSLSNSKTASGSIWSNTLTLYLARYSWGQYSNMEFDEFGIWNTEKNSTDISNLYNWWAWLAYANFTT